MRTSRSVLLLALAAVVVFGLWWSRPTSDELARDPAAPTALGQSEELTRGAGPAPTDAVLVQPAPGPTGDRSGVPAALGNDHDGVSDRIPEGMARLIVKVTGAPVSSQETARGQRRFHLVATAAGGSERLLRKEVDLEGAEATFPCDVAAGVPLQFSLVALGRSARLYGAPITLSEGAIEELLVDLGHGAVHAARVVEIPCDAVAGLRVESRGNWGSVRLPGGRTEPMEVRSWSVADESGDVYVLVPDGADVSYTVGLKLRSFAAEVVSLGATETLRLRPSVPIVTIRSRPGTKLLVEDVTVAAPAEWAYDHDSSESHVVLLPSPLVGRQRVVLDGKSLGIIGPDAWPSGGSHCLDVGDLVWAEEIGSVTFSLHGFEGQKATLVIYPYSAPLDNLPDSGIPMSTFDISLAVSRWSMPLGFIREPEHKGGGGKGLGKWLHQDGGQRSCTVFLEPGKCVACLQLNPSFRRVLRLEPIVVGARGTQTVLLDEALIEQWTIVPRDESGLFCTGLSMPGNLWVESIKLSPDRRVHGRWPYEDAPEDGPEPSFKVETFGVRPAVARLSRTPGANGLVVPLRAAVAGDAARGANLVAVVPTAKMVYVPLSKLLEGYLSGAVDGEVGVDDVDRMFSSDIEVVPNTVSYDEELGIGVALRSAQVTGVITEAERSQVHVRDWFTATAEGIELAGGGRGKWVTLSSKVVADRKLRLIPSARGKTKFQAAYHGMSYGNVDRQLWIPESAQRLEWWEGDILIGGTDDFSQDVIVIE